MITRNAIAVALRRCISEESAVSIAELQPTTKLNELGIDSFQELMVVMSIEDELCVELSDEDLLKVRTVLELEELVCRNLQVPLGVAESQAILTA